MFLDCLTALHGDNGHVRLLTLAGPDTGDSIHYTAEEYDAAKGWAAQNATAGCQKA